MKNAEEPRPIQGTSKMKKESVFGRLRNLYLLEFINAFLLPFGFLLKCHSLDEPVGMNAILAMILNGFLLLQGSYLWFRLSQSVRVDFSARETRIFKMLKVINITLILAVVACIVIYPFQGTWDKYGAIAFVSLAILEYINYFEFQLMYDNRNDLNYLRRYKRLKKAKLKRLLA